jgi:hypothetical protein
MRQQPSGGLCATLLVGYLVLPAACAESPFAPITPAAVAAPATSAAGARDFFVVPLQLRPEGGDELAAWGELTVFVGALLPPNPCLPAVQGAALMVCGVIHNPEEQLLTGGMIIVHTRSDASPIRFDFAAPPNPCLTYLVRAAATDAGMAGLLSLPAVQAVFTFEDGSLVSHTGGVNVAGGAARGDGGPAELPPNPCIVAFDTQRTG